MIAEEGIKLKQSDFKIIWNNSNLKILAKELSNFENEFAKKELKSQNIVKNFSENIEKVSTVFQGLKIYNYKTCIEPIFKDSENDMPLKQLDVNKYILKNSTRKDNPKNSLSSFQTVKDNYEIKLTPADRELLKKLDMEHKQRMKEKSERIVHKKETIKSMEESKEVMDQKSSNKCIDQKLKLIKAKKIPNSKLMTLDPDSKQRTIPSSRIERIVSFGTLAAGLGVGTVAEYARRTLGFGSSNSEMLFMTEANLNRIVDTLCKVRGAALKLGQIMSIQDESIIQPELAKALERVRKSADFMPDRQVDQVLSNELGSDWQSKIQDFQRKPFAAASIGQVHLGKTQEGQDVAIKIQYPGVAQSINSDIDNLSGIMNLWNIFPKGMFLENLMTVAKRELAWEVDYKREAECTKRFKKLLSPYPEYYVPKVIDELSTNRIFTAELLDGIPLDKCFELDDEHKHFIGYNIIKLCLLEILKFRFMQTDPNWANFLYNSEKKQIMLLDFGASREYSKEFMDKYVRILKAAYDSDRETIRNISGEIGFFTGYESNIMIEAHVDAVMILGEIFQCEEPYDFGKQNLTNKIQNLVPTMLNHRLCPPPEEIYSIHRKLSGIFLLCSKFKVPISCRKLFLELYNEYVKSTI
ncbi:hypothetical protein WA026_001767 [Henosepilachna vigintioctopunctata]